MGTEKHMSKGFKIFFLLFAIIVLVFIKEDNPQKFVLLFNNLTSKEADLHLDREYIGESLNLIDDIIVKWENNTISFLNEDGSENWSKKFEFNDPQIIFSQKYLYIMDKLTGDIYQLNNKGDTTFKLQLDNPILNIKESYNNLIIQLKNYDNESLEFMDIKGNKLGNLAVDESILTYSLNVDSSKYVLSTISIKDSKILSKLIVNTIGGEQEYIVEIPNEIIMSTEFNKNQILVITDLSIALVNKGEIEWSKKYPVIKDGFIYDNKIYLLYGDNLEIVDLKGETKLKTTFGTEYERIQVIGNYIALYGARDLLILQNDKEILKYRTEEDLIKITGNNSYIALHYLNKIEIHRIITKDKIK